MQIKSYATTAIAFCILALVLSVMQLVGAPLALASLPIGLVAVVAICRKSIADAVFPALLAIAVVALEPPFISLIEAVLIVSMGNILYALGLKRGAEANAPQDGKVIIGDGDARFTSGAAK